MRIRPSRTQQEARASAAAPHKAQTHTRPRAPAHCAHPACPSAPPQPLRRSDSSGRPGHDADAALHDARRREHQLREQQPNSAAAAARSARRGACSELLRDDDSTRLQQEAADRRVLHDQRCLFLFVVVVVERRGGSRARSSFRSRCVSTLGDATTSHALKSAATRRQQLLASSAPSRQSTLWLSGACTS